MFISNKYVNKLIKQKASERERERERTRERELRVENGEMIQSYFN